MTQKFLLKGQKKLWQSLDHQYDSANMHIRLGCKELLKINNVVCKLDARPLIQINSSPLMMGKWLFDTGAGLKYMSTQQLRLIPKEKRPTPLILGIDAIVN
jgi:hypothetical protein